MVRKLKLYLLMATLALSVSGCGKNSETEDAKSTSVSESSDLQNQEEVHSNPESNVLSPISRNNTAFWRAAAETADSLLLRLMIVILQCGHGKCAPSFLPDSGHKKSRITFSDFLLGCATGKQQIFSFLMACQFDKLEYLILKETTDYEPYSIVRSCAN